MNILLPIKPKDTL